MLTFNGGDYIVESGKLYTLTEPNRPCVKVNDTGRSYTRLTFDGTRFSQRLAKPAEGAQPIGNLLGVAVEFNALSKKSEIRFVATRGECFQQTSEGNTGALTPIGMRFKVTSTTGLEALLTARRVMCASTDWMIRFNAISAEWEVVPVGSNADSVTTRRFGRPEVTLSKYASGSAQAKSAPTTRGAGEHFYTAHAVDDRGRVTNLAAEVTTTLAAGEVPVLNVATGQPCRVILWHGVAAGVFTEWVEILSPLGNGALADMGNAIGGYEWSAAGLPFKPTTAAAENNTAAGRILLDANGVAEGFGTAPPTTGEWAKVGDRWPVLNGTSYVCSVAAAGNNGGTWLPLETGARALCSNIDPSTAVTSAALTASGRVEWTRLKEGGTISKALMCVTVASGNVCIAYARNTGSGKNAVPGALIATTGSFACPSASETNVSGGANGDHEQALLEPGTATPITVTLAAGDWVGVAADNTTATIRSVSTAGNVDTALAAGSSYRETIAAESPKIPTARAALVAHVGRNYLLLGQ
jgi:hypothetical protein